MNSRVKCFNPEVGCLNNTMSFKFYSNEEDFTTWLNGINPKSSWYEAFEKAWHGVDGWELWVEGEILFWDAEYSLNPRIDEKLIQGFSNLTDMIENNRDNIDWDKLSGVKAKSIHPENGYTYHVMSLKPNSINPEVADNWLFVTDIHSITGRGFIDGWCGVDGWSLWVEGQVPIKE